MCLICVELARDRLTTSEAQRNFGEMHEGMDRDHQIEVRQKIYERALKELGEARKRRKAKMRQKYRPYTP